MSEKIIIEEKMLGKIIIEPYYEIDNSQNMSLKSLAFLMLMCMDNDDETGGRFSKFLEIIKQTTTKVKEMYKEEELLGDINPTEGF